MKSDALTGHDATLRHARSEIEKRRGQSTALSLPSLMILFCILGILGACCSEIYSAGVGFQAAFPTKSDGTGLAEEMMTLRYPIVFCLLIGGIWLRCVPNQIAAALDRVLNGVGLLVILILLFGIGTFMFSATSLSLGSDDGLGTAGHLVGVTLGAASAAMFALSFLGSHALIGKLVEALPIVANGWAERRKIAAGEALIQSVEGRGKQLQADRSTLADMQKPNVIARKTAVEVGSIVGMVQADFHDLCASRKIRGDTELDVDDLTDVPDVPLAALEQRCKELEPYNFTYFFNLLKQKEA